MGNFAERIAYWYLRLNGFFVIENFVHHRCVDRDPADSDLLGIRLRHATELIGTDVVAIDTWLERHGFALDERDVAVVVQVKGGRGNRVGDAFALDRLEDAVRRFGIVESARAPEVAASLGGVTYADIEGRRVAKLLIGGRDEGTALHLPLLDAWRFVRDRFERFHARKWGDWNHFQDPMIQLLAWEVSEAARDEPPA